MIAASVVSAADVVVAATNSDMILRESMVGDTFSLFSFQIPAQYTQIVKAQPAEACVGLPSLAKRKNFISVINFADIYLLYDHNEPI